MRAPRNSKNGWPITVWPEYVPELKQRLEDRVNAMVAFAGESPEEFKARQEGRLAELAERFGCCSRSALSV